MVSAIVGGTHIPSLICAQFWRKIDFDYAGDFDTAIGAIVASAKKQKNKKKLNIQAIQFYLKI